MNPPRTVAEALAAARALGVERLDAHLLLSHLLARPRSWLLAHGEDPLPAASAEAFAALLQRRAAGEPLAYLVGEREFHGLALRVTPAVLVPRPDTETLVDWALELLPHGSVSPSEPARRVIDLGTGSGAIALAIQHRRPHAEVQAVDVSEAALAVAQDNARRLALDVTFQRSDWWSALKGQRFHLAVSNPPYIAQDDPHLAALTHEPLSALTPGGNGLLALEQLIQPAAEYLLPGGWLLLEHGHDQGSAVRERLLAAGFLDVSTRRDIESRERCSGGRRPG
ncbi:peptide chain release factor N(5)-glutamine methyltransferase [Ideonella sp. BN130291]|uniref:peptide chain release factor N(5)-glutamine methyltransferase n=1 Tax=Ideonella sp. BN130291 TaxID=3112940 RepID=UPI002E26B873|nr:peptide chain release factor N(5)-glutamine methyltransferase [Ideonella sp. BN130291]